jgi:hypothetical protein
MRVKRQVTGLSAKNSTSHPASAAGDVPHAAIIRDRGTDTAPRRPVIDLSRHTASTPARLQLSHSSPIA